ncbi:ROK family protein [uncultured Brevundimonas sp.]|uniref:ROK family protein n=1 Tax=uncultured Brevundimonas sp. TaxID=213418 RepID=UPI0030EE1FDC|tara:strand:- start:1415 stop:2350 length:936 start_codon:yes stop_codon:yes gene_type:complete
MQIGVDFGGTKIEAAALAADGRFLTRLREPNPGTYDAALAAVVRLVERIEREFDRAGTVGLAVPGSVSPTTGRMRNANSIWLNDRLFREDLETALRRPVRMANDANCLALSESVDGAATGAAVAFAVIIGTGCGGGLAVDGQLIGGANGLTGEWGHIALPWPTAAEVPGPTCWCGLHGCLETWISGTGFQRDHAEVTGRTLAAEAIVAAAGTGDPAAVASLERYTDRLSRALAMVVNLVDPDVVVLGGGLSNVADLYPRLAERVPRHVFADSTLTRIVPARWGDSSGVRGAARLWPVDGPGPCARGMTDGR